MTELLLHIFHTTTLNLLYINQGYGSNRIFFEAGHQDGTKLTPDSLT